MRYSKFLCGDCGGEFLPVEDGCGPVGSGQLCPRCLDMRAAQIQRVAQAAYEAGIGEDAATEIREQLPEAEQVAVCFKCDREIDGEEGAYCKMCVAEDSARPRDRSAAVRE